VTLWAKSYLSASVFFQAEPKQTVAVIPKEAEKEA
jgi:hypothetical protein